MSLIRHPKDFWSGAMFIAFGGAACILGIDYAMGSASRMGPGYFPRVLGLLLCAFGAILVFRSFRSKGMPLSFPTMKPLLVVLLAVVVFGAVVTRLGLALSTILLVVISSFASHEFRWKESIVASVVLAVFVIIAFRYGLDLQLPTWPPFLMR